MSKTKFPTIADIAWAILASNRCFFSVRYNPYEHIFIVGEIMLTKGPSDFQTIFFQTSKLHPRILSFKEGYDIYCKANE